jgi:hypothetical protein
MPSHVQTVCKKPEGSESYSKGSAELLIHNKTRDKITEHAMLMLGRCKGSSYLHPRRTTLFMIGIFQLYLYAHIYVEFKASLIK